MAEITVEFEVICTCGKILDVTVSTYNRHTTIEVEPCERCLDTADTKGFNRGYDEGVMETESKHAD